MERDGNTSHTLTLPFVMHLKRTLKEWFDIESVWCQELDAEIKSTPMSGEFIEKRAILVSSKLKTKKVN